MALITPVAFLSGVTVPFGSLAQQMPSVVNLSSSSGNAVAFNFLIVTGGVSVGTNPNLRFKFGFSNAVYTGSGSLPIIYGTQSVDIPVTTSINATQDVTTSPVSYITGNYMYVWFDQENILNTFTLSAAVLPVSATIVGK